MNNKKSKNNQSFPLLLVLLLALVTCSYCGYRIWTNLQPARESNKVQKELKENKDDFESLRRVNCDICAWVTLEDTKIDYPVLHGTSNFEYLNTDAYGKTSQAGSIFMDYRNSDDMSDDYVIIYGHHMRSGEMFGSIKFYEEKDYFKSHSKGVMRLPKENNPLKVIGIVKVSADDEIIYSPRKVMSKEKTQEILLYAEKKAINWSKKEAKAAIQNGKRLMMLSTCAYDFEDARDVLVVAW